jgi:hypothetical protein
VVNAIVDACYKSALSKKWEPVELAIWRGSDKKETHTKVTDYDSQHQLIKEEKMPDGKTKIILKDKNSGEISQIFKD